MRHLRNINYDYDCKFDIGGGFLGLLTILFIGLKLGNVIDWDWVWVLSPIWISFIVIVLIVVGFWIYYMITERN